MSRKEVAKNGTYVCFYLTAVCGRGKAEHPTDTLRADAF